MRKLLGITVCSLALVWAASAEAQTAGLKLGRVMSEFDGDAEAGATFERRGDWAAGLFLRFGIGPVSLQPEVLYTQRGSKVTGTGAGEFEMTYLEVPMLLRIGSGATALYGGGYGALKIDAKFVTTAVDPPTELDISAEVEDFDYGVVFGVGIGFGSVELDGRFTMGLAPLFKDPAAPEIKHRAISILTGITF